MEKILVLCSRQPYPPVSGAKIRMFNNIKMLSKKNRVDVLFITTEKIDKEKIEELKKYCENVIIFKVSKVSFILNTLFGLVKNKFPLQVNLYYFKKIEKWIYENHKEYKMFFCNHIRTAEYVREIKNVTKVVDMVDSIAMNYENAIGYSNLLWRIIYKFEIKRLKKYEVLLNKDFDKNIIISNKDKEYVIKNGATKEIFVINNFVNIMAKYKEKEEEKNSISFLGKMDYEPNITAIKFFFDEVYPNLRDKGNLKIYIIGSNPTKDILKYSQFSNVIVTGFLEDPWEYVRKSTLFIAPMISGSGVQNKIIEAMFLGKSVLTTKIGAEGLENLKGDELCIAENTEDFIKKLTWLLNDNTKRIDMGLKARKYVMENLSEECLTEKFYKVIEI